MAEAKKINTVVGATGAQGGSVIDHLLRSESQEYNIRAVTRSPDSAAAKVLAARGIEIVQAELTDVAALRAAFAGSYGIFAVTNFWGVFSEAQKDLSAEKDASLAADKAAAIETDMGINMANTALATETLGGKSQPPHYDYKARVTRYIKSKPELLAKTTFFWCAFYASNFAWDFLKPVYFPAIGQYVQMQATPSDQPIACIGNTRSNFGAFVGAALTQPETTRVGQTVFAFVERSTLRGLLKIWTEVHGVKATYVQIPRDTFFATWSAKAQEFTLGMEFWELVKDQEWTGEDRFLTYADLGLDITTLKSVKDSFAELEL